MERNPAFKRNMKRFHGEPSEPTVHKSSVAGGPPISQHQRFDQFVTKA